MNPDAVPLAALDPTLIRAAFQALGEGITIANADGRIIYSNPAADRILGITATEAGPEDWASHYGVFLPGTTTPFPKEDYPLVRAAAGEATDGVEMLIRNPAVPGGTLISASGRPVLSPDGEIRGAAVVFRDTTKLREAEAELKQTLTDLRDSESQKRELMAFLVHDMKGPLTSILGGAELMLMAEDLGEEATEDLRHIHASARSLHRMVLNLLDIQTAEDGGLEPEIEAVGLRGLFDQAAAIARTRGARPIVELPEDVLIHADPELLGRVLGNLVDNCIKYGFEGGRIWLEAEATDDGRIRISVRDEGPGVPHELRDSIFDKYAKAERDGGRRRGGSRGLGLRFCKVAVEAHGGRIRVDDNVPKGARFSFDLPMGEGG